jgi:hypothetical protein
MTIGRSGKCVKCLPAAALEFCKFDHCGDAVAFDMIGHRLTMGTDQCKSR